jgi:ATP-dependent protease Clp ATPase subunit
MNVVGQDKLVNELDRILLIFKESETKIRPHFILTGGSGSGKSHTIKNLCVKHKIHMIDINAAQLTKEGTSGNSLSKALAPIGTQGGKPVVCFVDEFDKLFISGNSNDSCAHESTTGVQNEFLKILESDTASVFGDYGKYIPITINNVLFVFAGAFNGEENITLDRLREIGLKTEFLGRVGLVYNTKELSLEDLFNILESSELLDMYCSLVQGADKEGTVYAIKDYLQKNYENNTLGARQINTLIHQYFIKGSLKEKEVNNITFQKKLVL